MVEMDDADAANESRFITRVTEQEAVDSHGPDARSPDPRAERTRRDIVAAVERLMTEHTTAVTVSEIAKAAGVSRSSFYAHFPSLDALAAEYLVRQFDSIGATSVDLRREDLLPAGSAARMGYRRLIEHMVEHYPFYSNVLELPLGRSVYDRIAEAYAARLRESMELLPVPFGVDPAIVATYIAGGALTLISAWMGGALDISDDELVDQLVLQLPAWFLE